MWACGSMNMVPAAAGSRPAGSTSSRRAAPFEAWSESTERQQGHWRRARSVATGWRSAPFVGELLSPMLGSSCLGLHQGSDVGRDLQDVILTEAQRERLHGTEAAPENHGKQAHVGL